MEVNIRVGGLILYKGKLLLLKRSPLTKLCPNMWEGVHGKIRESETEEQAILREVQEETGLQVKVAKQGPIFEGWLHSGYFRITPFLLESSSDRLKLSHGHTNFLWINAKDYVKYCPEMKPELAAVGLV